MIVLIPAYEPDRRLVDLVAELAVTSERIVVVNDGSGPEFTHIFDAVRVLGAIVLGYLPNRGKGHALKTGFEYIARVFPGEDVVCADSDGQHTAAAIAAVAAELVAAPGSIVLGARSFEGAVPLRSRFGNTATRIALQWISGMKLRDTQTGLRAYPADLLPWLGAIGGDRFEYELNVLLEARQRGIATVEVPIETVYIDGNAASHFRPFADSIRVYLPLAKFAASSLSAASLDFVLVLVLVGAGLGLLPSVVIARASSATLNFTVNRRLVFDPTGRTRVGRSLAGYAAVAGGILAANYGILYLLYQRLGFNLALAKIATESALFAVSYHAQRTFVFRPEKVEAVSRSVVADYR